MELVILKFGLDDCEYEHKANIIFIKKYENIIIMNIELIVSVRRDKFYYNSFWHTNIELLTKEDITTTQTYNYAVHTQSVVAFFNLLQTYDPYLKDDES